jgi:hypothetical protein
MLSTLNAAWRRNLGADDIAEGSMFIIYFAAGGLGDVSQFGSPVGSYFLGQRDILPIIAQMHTGVEVQLVKASEDIIMYKSAGLVHRLIGRFSLPDARAKMVTPQEQPVRRKLHRRCQATYPPAKSGRREARIAKLVDLIARRFNQDRLIQLLSAVQRCRGAPSMRW